MCASRKTHHTPTPAEEPTSGIDPLLNQTEKLKSCFHVRSTYSGLSPADARRLISGIRPAKDVQG